jgi:hypothetical protein
VRFAIEAADGSFANVSQHTADWALSRSKLCVHQRPIDDDDVSWQLFNIF